MVTLLVSPPWDPHVIRRNKSTTDHNSSKPNEESHANLNPNVNLSWHSTVNAENEWFVLVDVQVLMSTNCLSRFVSVGGSFFPIPLCSSHLWVLVTFMSYWLQL